MRINLTLGLLMILTLACADAPQSRENKSSDPPHSITTPGIISFDTINLARIEHLGCKGRVQDKEYNNLEVVDQLISRGTESIPFLMSKLEDETELDRQVIDYWYKVTVGDIAHIILSDFFTDSTWKKATIPGIEWDEMLERRNPDITGEQVLREYIEKHGRMGIRRRWEKIWEGYKSRLYWDEGERCFKVRDA